VQRQSLTRKLSGEAGWPSFDVLGHVVDRRGVYLGVEEEVLSGFASLRMLRMPTRPNNDRNSSR
jgi:hypothetical protein